jgi:hypothetical protein
MDSEVQPAPEQRAARRKPMQEQIDAIANAVMNCGTFSRPQFAASVGSRAFQTFQAHQVEMVGMENQSSVHRDATASMENQSSVHPAPLVKMQTRAMSFYLPKPA